MLVRSILVSVAVVLAVGLGAPVFAPPPGASALALGAPYRIVAASGSRHANNARYASDGNPRTSWRTTGAKRPRSAFVVFDLGQERPLGSVGWMFGRTGLADSYRVQASRDRVAWRAIGQGGNLPAGRWRRVATTGSARYVRFLFANPRRDRPLGYLAEVEIRSAPGTQIPPAAPEPQGDPIAFGVYTTGSPVDGAAIDAFAEKIGRMPAVLGMHKAWGDNQYWSSFQPEIMDNINSRGAMPLVVWEPWTPGGGLEQPAFRLANIVRGDHNAYIDVWAARAAADGRPFYLSFAPEMNGDWRPWGAGVNGNTAQDYVAAWRHIHGRFAAAGATNVRWVWAPNVADGPYPPMERFYPGDAYVDWVGLDGYNWGTVPGDARWRSFAKTFGPSYDALRALTDKPIIITEFASADAGGDKAAWIKDALQTQLPATFPRVRAVVWFDYNKERDWRVDSSAASLTAVREALRTPYLQGALP